MAWEMFYLISQGPLVKPEFAMTGWGIYTDFVVELLYRFNRDMFFNGAGLLEKGNAKPLHSAQLT